MSRLVVFNVAAAGGTTVRTVAAAVVVTTVAVDTVPAALNFAWVIPSGNLTKLLKMAIYSEFSH